MQKMMTPNDQFMEFSQAYDAMQDREGKALLCIMTTGGGMSISGLGVIPGASSRLAGTFHPYSMDELWEFVNPVVNKVDTNANKENWRSVHHESSLHYLAALKIRYPGKYFYVVSTAALETTRRRRGENVSYIAICRPDGTESSWKILLTKTEDIGAIVNKDGKSTHENNSDEKWNRMFKFKDKDGSEHLDLPNIFLARMVQDSKVTSAIFAIILNDPNFAHLTYADSIVKITENGQEVNEVWAKSPEAEQLKTFLQNSEI